MRIAIGCDHHGLEIKRAILGMLADQGHEYLDVGTHSADAVDYPDVAEEVARTVASGAAEQGILICGTGIGMSMSANKVSGIRAALCGDLYSARKARQHNDANILCLGGEVVEQGLALGIVEAYLTSGFEGGRHARRVEKIRALEQGRTGASTSKA